MMQRRNFILGMLTLVALAPIKVWAALWNRPAFEAIKIQDVTRHLSVDAEIPSSDIVIVAPERAENGAVVQVEVRSNINGTEAIAILVENNPTPLIANFMFSHCAEPFVVTRIKMAETSELKVVVKAGNQYFSNTKNITVLENGCG
jgi:sulfur-oxidizing protein SoxY